MVSRKTLGLPPTYPTLNEAQYYPESVYSDAPCALPAIVRGAHSPKAQTRGGKSVPRRFGSGNQARPARSIIAFLNRIFTRVLTKVLNKDRYIIAETLDDGQKFILSADGGQTLGCALSQRLEKSLEVRWNLHSALRAELHRYDPPVIHALQRFYESVFE